MRKILGLCFLAVVLCGAFAYYKPSPKENINYGKCPLDAVYTPKRGLLESRPRCIVNGTTFQMLGRYFQIWGIEIPEGREKDAEAFLAHLISNSAVQCVPFGGRRDIYISSCTTGKRQDIGEQMIFAGVAVPSEDVTEEIAPKYLDAAKLARAEHAGIWSK